MKRLAEALGETPALPVGKPGLDGHSNGAEQIAVRAADTGLEVIYDGIRVTPEQLVKTVAEHKRPHPRPVHPLRLPCAADPRGDAAPARRGAWRTSRWWPAASSRQDDVNVLKQLGVAAVYTPKDFDLNRIMSDLVGADREAGGREGGVGR